MFSKKWNLIPIHVGLATILLATTLGITGCGHEDRVETARLEKAFAAATGDVKDKASLGITAIKAKDYIHALPPLDELFQNEQITAEQKWALSEVLTQVGLQLEKTKTATASSQ